MHTLHYSSEAINRNNNRVVGPRNAARSSLLDPEYFNYNSKVHLTYIPNIRHHSQGMLPKKQRKYEATSIPKRMNTHNSMVESSRIIQQCNDAITKMPTILPPRQESIYIPTYMPDKFKMIQQHRKKKLQNIVRYHKQSCNIEDRYLFKILNTLSFQEL